MTPGRPLTTTRGGGGDRPGPRLASRAWMPSLVAAAVAAAMLGLASGPFDPPEGPVVVRLPPVSLTAPVGEIPAFPRSFEWEEIAGANVYEITVGLAREGAAPLFRQRGPGNRLDLAVEAGSEPPAGEYAWEVLALRGNLPVAHGAARFTVAPPRP